MKGSFKIALFTILSLIMSCNNEGMDTGNIAGTWSLTSIKTVSNDEELSCDGDWVWKFQGKVICLLEINEEMHERIEHYGTWSYDSEGKEITVFFNHSDNNNVEGTGVYSPPSQIFIKDLVTIFSVTELASNRMILQTAEYVYYFRKY